MTAAAVALLLAGPVGFDHLSPAGILGAGRTAFYVEGDTELPGYPAVFVGTRRGFADRLDVEIAAGGIDVAFVARSHVKLRLWESDDARWFLGFRLRLEFKRQHQVLGSLPTIDDFGFDVIPELSIARRFGAQAEHALYYAAFYYLDIDVRPRFPLQHYVMLGMLGYEYRFPFNLHLQADAAFGTELGNPRTAGFFFPRFRVRVGYSF